MAAPVHRRPRWMRHGHFEQVIAEHAHARAARAFQEGGPVWALMTPEQQRAFRIEFALREKEYLMLLRSERHIFKQWRRDHPNATQATLQAQFQNVLNAMQHHRRTTRAGLSSDNIQGAYNLALVPPPLLSSATLDGNGMDAVLEEEIKTSTSNLRYQEWNARSEEEIAACKAASRAKHQFVRERQLRKKLTKKGLPNEEVDRRVRELLPAHFEAHDAAGILHNLFQVSTALVPAAAAESKNKRGPSAQADALRERAHRKRLEEHAERRAFAEGQLRAAQARGELPPAFFAQIASPQRPPTSP